MDESRIKRGKIKNHQVISLDLFTESGSPHSNLLNYAGADLSKLGELLDDFVSKKLDIKTLEIMDTKYIYTIDDCSELIAFIESLHPFYEGNLDVLEQIIVAYLGYLYVKNNVRETFELECTDSANKWFEERVKILCDFPYPYMESWWELLSPKERVSREISKDLYAEYLEKSNFEDCSLNEFIRDFELQELVKTVLFWVFDADVPGLNQLTASSRALLFTFRFTNWLTILFNLFGSARPFETDVKRIISLGSAPEDMESEAATKQGELLDEYISSPHLEDLDMNAELSDETQNVLLKLAEIMKAVPVTGYTETYKIESLEQFLFLEIHQMIKTSVVIKKCKNCNMYFVVPSAGAKAEYCSRIVPGKNKKKCKDIGPNRTFKEKLESDIPLQMYRKAYRARKARIYRLHKEGRYRENEKFQLWAREAKANLNKVRANEMTQQEFETWLDNA